MQKFSAMVRQAMSGATKTRAEGEKPEEDMEDDIPVENEDDAVEGDKPEEDEVVEGEDPKEDAEDQETDKEMSAPAKAAYAQGRKAERKRMAAIMGNPAADANPQLAAHLAFATSMKAADAVATLKASGPGTPAGGKLAGRMASASQPRLGGSAAGAGPQTQPERIAAHAAAIIEAKRAKRTR